MAFIVPGYCPKCRIIFPTGMTLPEGGGASFKGIGVGPCPNGHIGYIPDGTYSVINGLMSVAAGEFGQPDTLNRIKELVHQARKHPHDAAVKVEQIKKLLPPESAAAVEQLSSNPLTIIMFVFYVLTALLGAMGGVPGLVSTFKGNPDTGITISPNITINNYGATKERTNPAMGTSRHDRRKSEKLRKQQERLDRVRQRQAGNEPETEV